MSEYNVDPDALFSDDDVPAPAQEEYAPAPPPKRPRPPPRSGGSALDALDSLDLSSFKGAANGYGDGGGNRGYGGRPGGNRGGYGGRQGGYGGRQGGYGGQQGGYGGRAGGVQDGGYGGRPGGYGGRSGGYGGGSDNGGYRGRSGGYGGGSESGGYGGRPGGYGGRSGGYGGRPGGHENGSALGDHMRAGAPAPAKGRPGIHPSRLANLAPARNEEVKADEDPSFLSREDQRNEALSILPESDRLKLLAAENESAVKRKRPVRRQSRNAAPRRDSAESGGSEPVNRRRGGGFNLMEAMKVVGSGNPRSSRPVPRSGPQRRSPATPATRKRKVDASVAAYMHVVMGEEGVKRKHAQEQKARDERKAEILWKRTEARRKNAGLLRDWSKMWTVANHKKDCIKLNLYEQYELFSTKEDKKERFHKMEAWGMERKDWKSRATEEEIRKVNEICFVPISDDI